MSYTVYFQDQTFYISFIETDPNEANNRTKGATVALSLTPLDGETLTVNSGETYTVESGTLEAYNVVDNDGTIVVESNATLVVYETFYNDGTVQNDGTVKTPQESVGDLFQYDRHAGNYALENTLKNNYYYKERIPTNANIGSLVVGIEPDNSLQSDKIGGVWGLVDNVIDERNPILATPQIGLEVTILAEYSEYNSVSDVQTDLEI